MFSFLKPSLLKVILFIVLFVLSGWLWNIYITSRISDTFPFGFPLQFFLSWGPCQLGENCSEFNELFLVFDIVIWYVVAAWSVSRFKRNA